MFSLSKGSLQTGPMSHSAAAAEQVLKVPHLLADLVNAGFVGGSMVKNLPANAGDTRDVSSIPGSGRFPGGGNGNPLQYSCLEDSMDRGAWRATSPGSHKESDTNEHTGTPHALVDAG